MTRCLVDASVPLERYCLSVSSAWFSLRFPAAFSLKSPTSAPADLRLVAAQPSTQPSPAWRPAALVAVETPQPLRLPPCRVPLARVFSVWFITLAEAVSVSALAGGGVCVSG